jgi:hypothetical protein
VKEEENERSEENSTRKAAGKLLRDVETYLFENHLNPPENVLNTFPLKKA